MPGGMCELGVRCAPPRGAGQQRGLRQRGAGLDRPDREEKVPGFMTSCPTPRAAAAVQRRPWGAGPRRAGEGIVAGGPTSLLYAQVTQCLAAGVEVAVIRLDAASALLCSALVSQRRGAAGARARGRGRAQRGRWGPAGLAPCPGLFGVFISGLAEGAEPRPLAQARPNEGPSYHSRGQGADLDTLEKWAG